MRLRAIVTAGAALSLAACAALSGLDQITESACAPGCIDDAGVETSAGDDAVTEGSLPDVGAVDRRSPEDAVTMEDGPSFDSDSGPDSESDAVPAPDAVADSVSDSVSDADAGAPSDAAAGTGDAGCGTVFLSENFDSSAPGWTFDATWAVALTCASPPAPQKGSPDPTVDHTTGGPGGVAGAYVCGNNPTGATRPFAYATSPAVDVSVAPSVILTFYRWLNSDRSGWMTSTVDVFDGSAWVNVYSNPSSGIVSDSVWTKVTYDVTAHKSAAFRVRFGYSVVDAGVYEMSCWNVDDVMLSSVACP
jgi:hypothetical protein